MEAMKKRIRAVILAAVLMMSMILPISAAEPAQQEQMESAVYPILLPAGENVPLSAAYFEMRLGLETGEIAAITITSLPSQGRGKLMLDGVEVQVYDTLLRSELDRLCYVQGDEDTGTGWFSFIPLYSSDVMQGQRTRLCVTFQVEEQQNAQRPIVQDVFCVTQPQTSVAAALQNLRGEVVYTLSRKPLQGTVSFEDGRCVYTPKEGAKGSDSFELTALDEFGGVSAPIQVSVVIKSE